MVDHAPQVGAGRVAQVRQRLARAARQPEARRAVGVGLAGGHGFLAQAHHLVLVGVQLQRLRGVVVGDQQVAAAFHQPQHRVVHVERDEPALDRPELLAQAGHPRGEEGEGQRVRHGELDHVLPRRRMAAQHGARALQRLQHLDATGCRASGRRA
jgi:hypothetical protein